jgi:hypothetical protein
MFLPPFLVLIVLAVALGSQLEPDPESEFLALIACRGEPQPVDDETLVRTVGRYGFELEREDLCFGVPDDPSAMFTNITRADRDTAESDVIFASDGEVWCDLYAGKRFGRDVERRRVNDEVVFQVLNVECRIYESDAWQIERLDDAMKQLARAG